LRENPDGGKRTMAVKHNKDAEKTASTNTPIGVYLRKEIRSAVDEIAEKEGVSRHAILAYAVTDFVRQYRAGKIKLKKKQTIDLDI
jgi:hypothetical protein